MRRFRTATFATSLIAAVALAAPGLTAASAKLSTTARLNRAISKAQKTANTDSRNITALQKSFKTLSTSVASLSSTGTAAIATLTGQVAALGGRVATLNGQVAALAPHVATDSPLVKMTVGQAPVTIASSGPFTLTATCTVGVGLTDEVDINLTSSEAGTAINGTDEAVAGTTYQVDEEDDSGGSGGAFLNNSIFTATAPSGAFWNGAGEDGVNVFGTNCFAKFQTTT
jgi:hypothetical protein